MTDAQLTAKLDYMYLRQRDSEWPARPYTNSPADLAQARWAAEYERRQALVDAGKAVMFEADCDYVPTKRQFTTSANFLHKSINQFSLNETHVGWRGEYQGINDAKLRSYALSFNVSDLKKIACAISDTFWNGKQVFIEVNHD